jgi:hypothetical protein
MDKSRAWFALGVVAALLMVVCLGQTTIAAGLYVKAHMPLSVPAMLNPLYSPLLALVAGLTFTVWTLARTRLAPR